jgi:subtilisin family serine protease
MADHGLFVAGIVHDIAPTCTLRIVRVLNQWGASYLSDLLAGLARLSVMSITGPVVVNMSLTVRMPSFAELQAQLAGSPYPVSLLAQMWTGLADACAPLANVLQLLESGQVMLVAATGNDSGNGPLRDPCAPAYFGSTLGVAAVDQANLRACYSNRGDDMTVEGDGVGNGIATFGGGASGIVHGLYSAPDIYLPPPMAALPNSSGWAQWMGTSFATPVIAALAANYLANNPATSPAGVMSQIQVAGRMTDSTLQAPTISATQVCS